MKKSGTRKHNAEFESYVLRLLTSRWVSICDLCRFFVSRYRSNRCPREDTGIIKSLDCWILTSVEDRGTDTKKLAPLWICQGLVLSFLLRPVLGDFPLCWCWICGTEYSCIDRPGWRKFQAESGELRVPLYVGKRNRAPLDIHQGLTFIL